LRILFTNDWKAKTIAALLGVVFAAGAQAEEKAQPPADPAFEAAKKAILQLTPAQIQEMNRAMDEMERSKSKPANNPTPIVASDVIYLAPGSPIRSARLAANNTSSLVFLDATGAVWPIESYDSNAEVFNITHPKTQKHVLKISPKTAYAVGNLSITLEKLDVPVGIQLVAGFEKVVDYRHEYHIDAQGPNARTDPSKKPDIIDDDMLSILDGVPPAQARGLKTSNQLAEVWELNGQYYIRTRAILLLPAPIARQKSSDGTTVYKTAKLPSLAMSENGRYVQVRVYE